MGSRTAATILTSLLVLALCWQMVVLAGLVPLEMVWGGRLQNEDERRIMTIVSMAILPLMIVIVLASIGTLGRRWMNAGRLGAWLMFALFCLNTVGNLIAEDPRERWIFTPITLLLAFLSWRVTKQPVQHP